jgi:hypothetical protein
MSKREVDNLQLIEFVWKEIQARKKLGNKSNLEAAARMADQVRFYKLGMEGKQPDEWKQYIPELTEAEKKQRAHPIQFEYCECGCHCHVAYSKGIEYTIYNSLEGGKPFSLRRGHGITLGVMVGGKRESFQECEIAAQADFDKIP